MKTARRLVSCAAALIFAACLAEAPVRAANDKELQNNKGSVSYQRGSAATPLAPNATTVLDDRDYAITGEASLATIGLPDSSRVLVGSSSKVQLAAFNQAENTRAKFVVAGKVRFIVEHPQGAKADFTFATATGSVAVRGTEGDIDQSGNDLRVNVYEVCDPSEPVVVTTSNGQRFTLVAGQSLFAQLVNGIVQAKVEQITQQLIDQFSPDFGVPTSWDAAKGQIISAAQSQASSTIDNATGGYGGQVAGAIGGLFHHKATPTPSPSPASTSCSH
ncbi:MAG TPA: FecR family protein [Candidatus Acidoferrales bacterium]|nr:FecR family protein [Candidatus Acidoferrales bacterium]